MSGKKHSKKIEIQEGTVILNPKCYEILEEGDIRKTITNQKPEQI